MKNNYPDRRKFINQSIAGLAGAMFLPQAASDTLIRTSKLPEKQKIITRTLGRTGIEIPIISMGAGDTNNPHLLSAALDSGIKYLATSQYYGNGKNEEVIGQAIKGRPRNSYIINTSVMPNGYDYKEGIFTQDANPELFIQKVDDSLKRLGIETLDIFVLPFLGKKEAVYFEPMLKAMERIKKSGKAKYIGIATHGWEDEAVRAAADVGIYDVAITAYNFRKENLEALNQSIEYAAKKGLGIIAMKTMAGTYWDKERTIPIDSKAAIKWVLQNEYVHTVIPGVMTFDQLASNLSIMNDPILTPEEKKLLKLSSAGSDSLYCKQCRTCIGQCPKHVDIPTLMRGYMYAYGHRNLAHAKQTLGWAGYSTDVCADCHHCSVHCVQGFNIKERIASIAQLQNITDDLLA